LKEDVCGCRKKKAIRKRMIEDMINITRWLIRAVSTSDSVGL
jgi:hypothetical protein